MKIKFFLIALIFCSFLDIRSQVYLAGNNLGFYTDIIPDTTIIRGWPVRSYSLSLFGSSVPNFSVMAYDAIGAPGYTFKQIDLCLLDPNLYISLERWDSLYYNSTWVVHKVPKKLSLNDTINKSNATWYNSNFCLTQDNGMPSAPNHLIIDWVGSNDKYIGLKYQNAFATEYGWIRFSVPSLSVCVIKDYSTTSISTAISNIKISDIEIFPNPFLDEIYLENSYYEKIEFYDCLSRKININTEISGNKTKININPDLPKGVYYLKVSGKNGTFSKKLIKA